MGTIYRTNKEQGYFVQIDRRCLDDKRLSWKSKGLLCYMLSMPDDWVFYETELVKHSKDSITVVKSAVQELLKCGYMIKTKKRNEKGQFDKTEIIVYEYPKFTTDEKPRDGKTMDGKTTRGKTIDGNRTTTNTDSTNTDSQTKKEFTNTNRPTDPEKYLENFVKELPNNPVEFEILKICKRIKFEEELLAIVNTYPDDRISKWLVNWRYRNQNLPSIYSPDEVVTGSIPPPDESIKIPPSMSECFDKMFQDMV